MVTATPGTGAPVPLEPYRYPPWLTAIAIAVAAALTYSAFLAPPYLDAYLAMEHARAGLAKGDRAGAEALLEEVLRAFPSSKPAHIEMAIVLLSSPTEAQHERAMSYLQGIELNTSEWERVSAVLPGEYRNRFTTRSKHSSRDDMNLPIPKAAQR